MMTQSFWRGKRVFLTGHTGFKGSWLSLWLTELGADLCGYALAPDSTPDLFTALELPKRMQHILGDICDRERIASAIKQFKPDIVFHLAAQAIVGRSYKNPFETYNTNVMGTLNVLEAIRTADSVRAAVVVTSDKCYENRSTGAAFKESDRLGGDDIYSSSKACTEILTGSYFHSFLKDTRLRLATGRAGNVIGGGDFADFRIVPDIVRASQARNTLVLRRPQATRPWQHVLEPLRGYMMLAQQLDSGRQTKMEGWNFGPDLNAERPVIDLVKAAKEFFPELEWKVESPSFEEAQTLALDSTKAREALGWQPGWDFSATMVHTLKWYHDFFGGEKALDLCRRDLQEYEKAVSAK
jgi:CDP-glucose 4,6-dehydratase